MEEELKIQHISGEVEIYLKGCRVQIKDLYTNQLGSTEFSTSSDAMRFVGEYLSHVEGPTEEFQRRFPHMI